MSNRIKLMFVFSVVFFMAACNGSTSDAKKVEVKKVVATSSEKQQDAAPTETDSQTNDSQTGANKLADDTPEFIAGKHFVEIVPPMNTDVPAGKVEVVELMWLGCPHCYELEPTMQEYKKNKPDYVEFKQVPAMLNPNWAADGNTYLIAEILDPKGEKELTTKIFEAIHEQNRRLSNPESAKRFFMQQGVSEEVYNNAKNSLEFKVKIKRAQEISASSQARSVPAVIINGKYRTSPYLAGSEENLIKIVDMLTRKEKK